MAGGYHASAVCRKCGQSAPASEFKMHLEEHIMVCPRCIANFRAKSEAAFLAKKKAGAAGDSQARPLRAVPAAGKSFSPRAGEDPDDDGEPVIERLEKKKPSGWDAEDELLDKLSKQKQKNKPGLKPLHGSDLSMCTCRKCEYHFKYDSGSNKPSRCPYCNTSILSKASGL